jgi:4a-hydroxytetrahydrobiopterin dehydratase
MSDIDPATRLTRGEASDAVESIGWRYLLATLCTSVAVRSYREALGVATATAEACGEDAAGHLRLDLRPDRVEVSVQDRAVGAVTVRDVALARGITAAIEAAGGTPGGGTSDELPRPVQMLELGIDAMDIQAIRPFWKAALAYVPQADDDGPEGGLVDPTGQLPAVWFQQMDKPRPQRNRIHLDITVAHDEAEARVKAALAAGGTLLSDKAARSFWVLADAEGNEVCVCTWMDRDPVAAG